MSSLVLKKSPVPGLYTAHGRESSRQAGKHQGYLRAYIDHLASLQTPMTLQRASASMKRKQFAYPCSLVVATIHLPLRVKDAPPVLRLELSLCVHVNLHLDRAALLAHRDCAQRHPHKSQKEEGRVGDE